MGRTKKFDDNSARQRAYRERKARDKRNATALQNDKQLLKIERPPIRYYGGKWRIEGWVVEQFPVHTCYCEPFCGGASVLLQKRPSRVEVMNDLNHDLITFFDVLRERPAELIRAILLTPYSREELRRARTAERSPDRIETARRFYVRCWQSFGSGVGTSSTGWRYQIGTGDNSRASAIGSWNDTDHLWAVAERLKQVFIEHDDAFKVIERFDSAETLFYLDPPYVHSTRYHNSSSKGYSNEMTDDDHRKLAELARSVAGFVIVSGYPSVLYDELYAGWQRITRRATDLNGGEQEECLWLSPRTASINHLPLFAQSGD
jgi:DNA adenine methylase